MGDTTCTRCGGSVPSILSGPPDHRDTWWRNQIRIDTRCEVTHTLRMRMFKRRWMPEDPRDQVSETYTTLDLCDDCAAAVFAFAQNRPSTRDGLAS